MDSLLLGLSLGLGAGLAPGPLLALGAFYLLLLVTGVLLAVEGVLALR